MQRRFGSVTAIGKKIGINDDNGYLVAIFIALIVVAVIVAGYYLVLRPQPEPYSTIYLLDNQKQASNYPQLLVANQNSTFSVYVAVENHVGGIANQTYQVQTKITQNLPATLPVQVQPTDTYNFSLADGANQQKQVTVTENTPGSYWVVFELWRQDGSNYVFTQDYCVLSIEVVN